MKIVCNCLVYLGFLALVVSCDKPVSVRTGLIPQPSSVVYENGTFEITNQTVIMIDSSADSKHIADELSSFLQANFQLNIKSTTQKQSNAIQLVKTSSEGIFYGLQTLKQLLTPKRAVNLPLLDFVTIIDAPQFKWRGMQPGIDAANAGHNVVMSPGSPCYFDHFQGKSELEPPAWGGYNNLLKVYDFDPIPSDIEEDKKHHILGAQANLWTERIPTFEHVEYMILPRLCAFSEALWTSPDQKDRNQFAKKLDFHFDRLSELGYNYARSSMSPEFDVTYNKRTKDFDLTLKNELDAYEIRYTLDDTEPTMNSALYTKKISYSSPINLHAQCFRYNSPIGFPLIKLFSTGFGDQCKVRYKNAYNEGYSAGGDRALFDNKFATNKGDDINWQGVQAKDFDIRIDLGEPTELSYVGLNFFQHIGATSVMLPTQVTISVSEDGKIYQTVLNQQIPTTQEREPIIKRVEAEFEKRKVAFIKIDSKNRKVLPDWHIRDGDA